MLLLLHHLYVVHGSSDHFQCKFHSVRILHTHLQAVGYSLSEGHSMTLMCRNVNIYLSGRNLQDLNSQRNSVLSLPIHTVFQVQNTHGTLRLLIHNLEHCCLFLYWNYFPYCYYLSYCLMSWKNYSLFDAACCLAASAAAACLAASSCCLFSSSSAALRSASSIC